MFSKQVKKVRIILNYSQDKLAQSLGVSFATINRWENSKNEPSKLAQKLFYDFCENNFIDVEELKKLRNKHKISQYKIAKDTGLSKSTISRIESFQQKPTLMVLYIIADYLQEDLGKILSYIYSAYKNK